MAPFAPHDRPREKLRRLGSASLDDHELVALIVGYGNGQRSVVEIADQVLTLSRGVRGLTRLSVGRLRAVPGVGAMRAAQILAAVELGRRTLTADPDERVQLASPTEAAAYLLPRHGAWPTERFGLALLDTKHRVVDTVVLTSGTLDASLVHPREVFGVAAEHRAAAVVLFHNHPSGDPSPSAEDAALTRRLVDAGDLMGIDVLDHLVLADDRYFSFKEAGRLRS